MIIKSPTRIIPPLIHRQKKKGAIAIAKPSKLIDSSTLFIEREISLFSDKLPGINHILPGDIGGGSD